MLSCSAPACRACRYRLADGQFMGHDSNFGTPATSYYWWPCVELLLHPTSTASWAGSSTSITTSRWHITREPRGQSLSSQWRWGRVHPATGAMERRCHTADHSLSAESCSETTLQRHAHEDFRTWALWTTGISWHLHRLLPRLARMQGIFDLRALISSDSQLTASIFSLVCRGSRDQQHVFFI